MIDSKLFGNESFVNDSNTQILNSSLQNIKSFINNIVNFIIESFTPNFEYLFTNGILTYD